MQVLARRPFPIAGNAKALMGIRAQMIEDPKKPVFYHLFSEGVQADACLCEKRRSLQLAPASFPIGGRLPALLGGACRAG